MCELALLGTLSDGNGRKKGQAGGKAALSCAAAAAATALPSSSS